MCVLLIRRHSVGDFRKVQKIHETKLILYVFIRRYVFTRSPKRVQLKKKKSLRGGEGNARARGGLDNNRLLDRRL